MSGIDEVAGTADDYTVGMSIADNCAGADVEVRFEPFADPLQQPLGVCTVDLEFVGPSGLFEIHHSLKPFAGEERAIIQVNSVRLWDVIFADGFESGDLSSWSLSRRQ